MDESPEESVTWPGWEALRPDHASKRAESLENEVRGLRELLGAAECSANTKAQEIAALQQREAEMTLQLEHYTTAANSAEEKNAYLRSSLAALLGSTGSDAALVEALGTHMQEMQAVTEQNVAYRDLETATRSLLNVQTDEVSTIDALDSFLREHSLMTQAVVKAEECLSAREQEAQRLSHEGEVLSCKVESMEQLLESLRQEKAALSDMLEAREALVHEICCIEGSSFEGTCRYIRDKLLVYTTYEEGKALIVSEMSMLKEALHAVATGGGAADTSLAEDGVREDFDHIKQMYDSREEADRRTTRLKDKLRRMEKDLADKCTALQELVTVLPPHSDPLAAVKGLRAKLESSESRSETLTKECAVLKKKLDAARKDTREAAEATVSSAVVEVKTAKRLKDEQVKNTAFIEAITDALNMKGTATLEACVRLIKHMAQDRRRLAKAQKETQSTISSLRESVLRLRKEKGDTEAKVTAAKSSVSKLTRQLRDAKSECKEGTTKCAELETAMKEHERRLCTEPRSPPTPPTPPCEVEMPVLPHAGVGSLVQSGFDDNPEAASRTVCLVGIDMALPVQSLASFLQSYGRVVQMRLCTDGKVGYGFCEYNTREGAAQLVEESQQQLGEGTVSCSWSRSAISKASLVKDNKAAVYCFVYDEPEDGLHKELQVLRQREADNRSAEQELKELGSHSNEAIRVIRELLDEREALVKEKEDINVLHASTSAEDGVVRAMEAEVQVLTESIGEIAQALHIRPDALAVECVTAVKDLRTLCDKLTSSCTDLRKSVNEYKNVAIEVSKPRVDRSSSSHDRVEVACGGRDSVPCGEVAEVLMSLGLKDTQALPLVASRQTVRMEVIETVWKQHFFKQLTTSLMNPTLAAQGMGELLRTTSRKTFLKDLLFEWYLCALAPYVPPGPSEIDTV